MAAAGAYPQGLPAALLFAIISAGPTLTSPTRDAPPMSDDTAVPLTALERLKQREAKLKEQIKAEQAKVAKKEAALHQRKCQAVGAAVLACADEDPEFARTLQALLDRYVTDKPSRKLLGLAGLQEPTGQERR